MAVAEKLIGLLSEYVEKNPSDLEFYNLLGTMLREAGMSLKATKIHRNILAKPSLKKDFRIKVMSELARDMFILGSFAEARNIVNEILKLDSKNHQAMLIQYELFRAEGQLGRAVEIAEKALSLTPKNISILYTDYARQLIEHNDLSKAKKILKKALQACNENIDAKILEGDLDLRSRRFKEAIDSYFAVMEMNPAYTSTMLKKIEDAFYMGSSYDDYSSRLRDELEYKNDNPDLHCGLGKFLKKRMLTDEAKDEFKKALEFNPTHLNSREELLETLIEEGKVEKIKEEVRELFAEINKNTYYFCTKCSTRDRAPRWKCPSCGAYDSYEKMVFLF